MENWHLPTTAMRIFSLERNVLMFLSALAAPKHAANAECIYSWTSCHRVLFCGGGDHP
jgi:hypothetical protein